MTSYFPTLDNVSPVSLAPDNGFDVLHLGHFAPLMVTTVYHPTYEKANRPFMVDAGSSPECVDPFLPCAGLRWRARRGLNSGV